MKIKLKVFSIILNVFNYFLDTLIERKEKVTGEDILPSVYRKATFYDYYLNFNSENLVSHKVVVDITLVRRTKSFNWKKNIFRFEI